LFQSYRESVPQDHPVDREVMRISATDIDNGNNSIVIYTLEPKHESDQGYLRIDANTGVIFLNRTINVSHKVIAGHMMVTCFVLLFYIKPCLPSVSWVFSILILCAVTEQVGVVVMLLDMYLKDAMLEVGQVICCPNRHFICLSIYLFIFISLNPCV
jgi:hypothetical protein